MKTPIDKLRKQRSELAIKMNKANDQEAEMYKRQWDSIHNKILKMQVELSKVVKPGEGGRPTTKTKNPNYSKAQPKPGKYKTPKPKATSSKPTTKILAKEVLKLPATGLKVKKKARKIIDKDIY